MSSAEKSSMAFDDVIRRVDAFMCCLTLGFFWIDHLAGSVEVAIIPPRGVSRVLSAAIVVVAVSMLGGAFEVVWDRSALEVASRAHANVIERDERYRALLKHSSEGICVFSE